MVCLSTNLLLVNRPSTTSNHENHQLFFLNLPASYPVNLPNWCCFSWMVYLHQGMKKARQFLALEPLDDEVNQQWPQRQLSAVHDSQHATRSQGGKLT